MFLGNFSLLLTYLAKYAIIYNLVPWKNNEKQLTKRWKMNFYKLWAICLISFIVLVIAILATTFVERNRTKIMSFFSPDDYIAISAVDMKAACEQGFSDGAMNYGIRRAMAEARIPLSSYNSSVIEDVELEKTKGSSYVQVKRTCQEIIEIRLESRRNTMELKDE